MYRGAWSSASAKPLPAMMILRKSASLGSLKWTSQVATTGLWSFSPILTMVRLYSRRPSMSVSPLRTMNMLLPMGWISR